MQRLWPTLIALLILVTASLSTEDALAQYNTAPVSWTGDYVPVVVNDPRMTNQLSSAGDPYALVASRRNLPWLGNMFGSNANSAQIVGPAANSPNTSGGSPLLGGGAGFRGDGPSLWTQSPWIGNGNLFPNAYGAVNQRLWLRGEWLLWDTKAMETPPLVTASSAGTPRETAAVLGESDTAVLFGGRQINGDTVSGFRLGGGFWITPQQNFAVEAEYFQLAEQDDGIRGGSDGSAILGRPFFDIVAGQETAQLISYPGVVAGNGSVETATNLRSILFNGRAALCPSNGTCCNTCGIPDRVDWILGYRHMQLDDTITIRENLRSLLTSAPGTIALTDRFYTENEFHGMQLGVAHRANFQRAWLESMLRVALGVNQQTVRISGSNTITEAGLTDTLSGGLLAQRTNSGNHERDKFTMIPEVTTRLGIRLTQSLHATVGYSVIYFPNVVRAGDHIDTDVNPGLIPPEAVPLTGALRPRFRFVETDYWAHGLTLGGEWAF